MRLNGWQRIWIVLSGLWMLLLLLVGYVGWPTSGHVLEAEVFNQLHADAKTKLIPPIGGDVTSLMSAAGGQELSIVKSEPLSSTEALARRYGGKPVPVGSVVSESDLLPSGTRIDGQGRVRGAPQQTLAQQIRKRFPGAYDDLNDQELEALALAKYQEPPIPVTIATHNLEFRGGVSRDEIRVIIADYTRILNRQVSWKRAGFVAQIFCVWAIPIAFVYGLGWAIAWIRQGFARPRPAAN